ncbi:hypothetical protein D3C72_2516770 [compost metagenome]
MAATMMVPMADHWTGLRCSPSTSMPAIAAMAGSVASMVENVPGDSRFKANISSEYGIALDTAATASP